MKRLWLEADAVVQGQVRLGEFNLLWAFHHDEPLSLASLPLVNDLYREYQPQGLYMLGLSTGMDGFDADAERHTRDLLAAIESDPELEMPPFPIMMDHLHHPEELLPESYISFLCDSIPAFASWPINEQEALRLKARRYLSSASPWAVTLTLSELAGTPALILFNRYYEVLEAWTVRSDIEEVHAGISYWLSHVKLEDLNVDPY